MQLFKTNYLYTVFKILIFAPIAEELLFKNTIRSIVKNNVVFIIASSLLYTAMNFIFTTTSLGYMAIDIIQYFIFSVLLCFMYIKNRDNIVVIMFIKCLYNLIPIILYLIQMEV